MIELSQSPIDESKFAVSMIDHDVVWLDVSVGNTLRVAEIQGTEHLEDVVPNVEIGETLVQCAEVNITSVDVLHNQSGCLSHWVTHNIDQVDDIKTSLESL